MKGDLAGKLACQVEMLEGPCPGSGCGMLCHRTVTRPLQLATSSATRKAKSGFKGLWMLIGLENSSIQLMTYIEVRQRGALPNWMT